MGAAHHLLPGLLPLQFDHLGEVALLHHFFEGILLRLRHRTGEDLALPGAVEVVLVEGVLVNRSEAGDTGRGVIVVHLEGVVVVLPVLVHLLFSQHEDLGEAPQVFLFVGVSLLGLFVHVVLPLLVGVLLPLA